MVSCPPPLYQPHQIGALQISLHFLTLLQEFLSFHLVNLNLDWKPLPVFLMSPDFRKIPLAFLMILQRILASFQVNYPVLGFDYLLLDLSLEVSLELQQALQDSLLVALLRAILRDSQ